jgi:hypothetical protein
VEQRVSSELAAQREAIVDEGGDPEDRAHPEHIAATERDRIGKIHGEGDPRPRGRRALALGEPGLDVIDVHQITLGRRARARSVPARAADTEEVPMAIDHGAAFALEVHLEAQGIDGLHAGATHAEGRLVVHPVPRVAEVRERLAALWVREALGAQRDDRLGQGTGELEEGDPELVVARGAVGHEALALDSHMRGRRGSFRAATP